MTERDKQLARTIAVNIESLESRSDFGGMHSQAVREFTELVFAWGKNQTKLYTMPNGRKTKDISKAVASWSANAEVAITELI